MQTIATESSSKTSAPPHTMSFAGALATATDPAWDDDGLADDVATISYEQALRNHALSQPESPSLSHALHAPRAAAEVSTAPSPHDACYQRDPPGMRPLKTASVTIRLSEPDCRQLRDRAAEAGLTVSAYLRSCALEVESLRAQVKAALAQLENPAAAPTEQTHKPHGAPAWGGIFVAIWQWLRHLRLRRQPAIRLNPSNPFAPVRY